MDALALLQRFLELADGSEAYFISGSFSFLPRLGDYREPAHDLDIAVEAGLFRRIRARLHSDETVHVLSLPEIALADASIIARLLPVQTSFVHITTPAGLLDLAQYRLTDGEPNFRLGLGLRLALPRSVLDRVETVTWRGISYRAGPIELAFIPKAVAHARRAGALPVHHVEDLRRLAPLVEHSLLKQLACFRGLRWCGYPLPRRLDPFTGLENVVQMLADGRL